MEEGAALKKFKEEDYKMDKKLDIIIAGTEDWKRNAQMMGEVLIYIYF